MVAKMTMVERAKQFLPFDALKGYSDVIDNKQKILVAKKELSEDDKNYINKVLSTINKKDIVEIIFFCQFEYVVIKGMVSNIDTTFKKIKVIKTEISFDDIYSVKKIKEI